MGWDPKATSSSPDRDDPRILRKASTVISQYIGWGEQAMMALRRHALWGWGKVAAPRRPGKVDGYACCSCGTPAQGVCGRRVGGAWELPPQRDIGRSLEAPVWWWRRRRALPRLYGGACRGCTAGLKRGRTRWTGMGREPRVANGLWTGAFRLLHYVLSCRAFCQLRRRRWRRGGARACVSAAGCRWGGQGQADGSLRDVADDVRLDPWRLGRCLGRLLLDHPHLLSVSISTANLAWFSEACVRASAYDHVRIGQGL